jgi:organic radical activating enzyme
VYPQREDEAQPDQFADMSFEYFFLQPCDDENLDANTRDVVDYCLRYPQWRLSLQTHKILGID